MAEPRYRVGIIGTGRIASTIQDEVVTSPFSFLLPYSHAGAYEAHPATKIVAAADPNAERLRGIRRAMVRRPALCRLPADALHGRSRYRQRLRADESARPGHVGDYHERRPRRLHGEADRPNPAGSGRHDRGHRPGRDQGGCQPRAHLRSLLPAHSLVDRIRDHWPRAQCHGALARRHVIRRLPPF